MQQSYIDYDSNYNVNFYLGDYKYTKKNYAIVVFENSGGIKYYQQRNGQNILIWEAHGSMVNDWIAPY